MAVNCWQRGEVGVNSCNLKPNGLATWNMGWIVGKNLVHPLFHDQKMPRISFTSWFCQAEDGHCHTLCTILWNFRHSRYRWFCCKHESTNYCRWKVTPVEVGFSYESHDLSGFLWYIPRWLARFLNHQPYQTELCVWMRARSQLPRLRQDVAYM